ncbi:hypothetical protein GWK47_031919 [Chionoecetes opilio]|uniref:Uncharacterized protein n=1 Tax=Chionoecetes opilio TaxID=41210 RepID=A0A8J4YIK2_CHIOP|nr:hypothetical protein GWK47_031919 [Chionoecetes opilio]
MAKAIYGLKLSDAEIPAVADWSSRMPEWNECRLFVALCVCKQCHEAPISVKAPLNDVLLFPRDPQTYLNQPLPRQQNKHLRRPCGTFSEENADLAFFDSRTLMWRRRTDGQALDKPSPPQRELKRLEGKKDDDVLPPSRPSSLRRHGPSFRNSTRTRASGQRTRPLGEEDDDSRTSRKRALSLRVVQRCRGAGHRPLVQRLPGVPPSRPHRKSISSSLVHHHRKLVGRESNGGPSKKAFLNETMKLSVLVSL